MKTKFHEILCKLFVCVQKNCLSFLLPKIMAMDTQISKKNLAFCYQTCPLIARRIIGGNFFGGCFKTPIFSSKTS
jgi:hypothetical protein